jgi:hypothetical protein
MFGWLRRLFGKTEPYSPKERLIFEFWNGEKTVQGDPMRLYKKMMDVGPALSIALKVAKSQSKDAGVMHSKAVKLIKEIFSIKDLDGVDAAGTLTEPQCLDLLDEFMEWNDDLKKATRRSQTTSKPSAASEPTSDEGPPTESTTDSGSTGDEYITGEAVPSPTGSESPSDSSTQAASITAP